MKTHPLSEKDGEKFVALVFRQTLAGNLVAHRERLASSDSGPLWMGPVLFFSPFSEQPRPRERPRL
jgi:hypothetical protein